MKSLGVLFLVLGHCQEVLFCTATALVQIVEVHAWAWQIYQESNNCVNCDRCKVCAKSLYCIDLSHALFRSQLNVYPRIALINWNLSTILITRSCFVKFEISELLYFCILGFSVHQIFSIFQIIFNLKTIIKCCDLFCGSEIVAYSIPLLALGGCVLKNYFT